MTAKRIRYGSLPLVVVVLATVGCGGSSSDPPGVTGKVTYEGKPATGIVVKLTGTDGKEYKGPTQPDGGFTITGVPDGEMTVTFEPATDTGNYMDQEYEKIRAGADKKANVPPPPPKQKMAAGTKLPEKYKDAATSGQTWTVDKNNRSKTFDLTK